MKAGKRILIVSPNLCVDRICRVPGFAAGSVNRAQAVEVYAGGKGLNAARVINELGGDCRLLGFVGGDNGRIISRSVKDEGIEADLLPVDGESRLSTLILDPLASSDTVVNESGPLLTKLDAEALLQCATARLKDCGVLLICGSLPPGIRPGLYAELIRLARQAGMESVLDSSGDVLKLALEAGPTVVKPNLFELQELAGDGPLTTEDAAVAARDRLGVDVRAFVVTLGAEGALLVTGERSIIFRQPKMKTVSCVGCGDAMAAGLALALSRGEEMTEACRLGMAAAAANTLLAGPGMCRRGDVQDLLGRIKTENIGGGRL